MRRRQFVFGLGVATAGVMFGRSTAVAQPVSSMDAQIEALQQQWNATIGVYAVNPANGRTVTFRDGELFAMCSTFKAYLAAAVLRRADRGELSLQDTVAVNQSDILPNSPVTEPAVGSSLTLSELCRGALQQSDNAAANLLLRTLGGPQAVTDFARDIGDERTRLDRWETELNSALPGDPRDTSSPRALGDGFVRLLTGDALAEPSRRQLDEWMRANQTSSMRAGLPDGWSTADKTGSGDYGSTNDVGIAYGPGGEQLVLAIMTRSAGDDPDAENMRPLIGDVTAAAVPWLLGAQT